MFTHVQTQTHTLRTLYLIIYNKKKNKFCFSFALPAPYIDLLYNILKITKEYAYFNTNICIVRTPLGFLLGKLLTILIKNERAIFK